MIFIYHVSINCPIYAIVEQTFENFHPLCFSQLSKHCHCRTDIYLRIFVEPSLEYMYSLLSLLVYYTCTL